MTIVYPRKHLTNLNEWRRLGEANIFPPESRLELIQGEIFEMPPPGFNHAGHINRINRLFSKFLDERFIVSIQNPLQLGDFSEPEPDFMLLKKQADFYSTRHPVASDVYLLIEVADTSLSFDQNQKLRLYALYGIPEYWLLNLNDLCLEVYRDPRGGSYTHKIALRAGDSISLSQLSDIAIDFSDIL